MAIKTKIREKIRHKDIKNLGVRLVSPDGDEAYSSELPDELVDKIIALITKEREALAKEIEGMKEDDEIQIPRLFQSNPTPNEWGGYSSVPFYCSLCGTGEMEIQDNKLKDDEYACVCSVWDSPTGGKWIRWNKSENEIKKIIERFHPNGWNSALTQAAALLRNTSEGQAVVRGEEEE